METSGKIPFVKFFYLLGKNMDERRLTEENATRRASKCFKNIFKYYDFVLQSAIQYGIIKNGKEVFNMATKSANVTARVQPEIKRQAEAVLDRLGLPVSVLIDALYRQIIMTESVPFSLSIPKLPTRDSLTDAQFNTMMETGYNQAKSGEGMPIDEAFVKIREGL